MTKEQIINECALILGAEPDPRYIDAYQELVDEIKGEVPVLQNFLIRQLAKKIARDLRINTHEGHRNGGGNDE